MGKKKFNKKQTVRFVLVPGVDEHGNPANTFKPVEKKSNLTITQKQQIIKEFCEYDQIEINGKPVSQSEIPSYILQQIRGRSDLVINQRQQFQEEEFEEQLIEEQEDWEEEEWVDDAQWTKEEEMRQVKEEKTEKIETIQYQGKQYNLSQQQMKLLDCVLPQNYEQLEIKGVDFVKFNEDGNRLDQKEFYEQYIAEDKERAVVDSYQFVPEKPTNFFDTDLKPSEIKGDVQEVEDALDYEGEEVAYQELEDDFFAKLISGNEKKPKEKQKPKENIQTAFKKKPKIIQEKEVKKKENYWEKLQEDQIVENDEEITDKMLDEALENFDKNIEEENSSFSSFGIADIENREEYKGKDGELDWRMLTKKQKKQYMKTKKIREFFDEVREREIEEKMKDKKNISSEDLHLKQLVAHIPYDQDHVLQNSLKKDAETPINFDEESDYETESSQDDIISYKQKTSIISSNLAVIDEKRKKKQKTQKKEEEIKQIERIKVIGDQRSKNETKQERKERKDKLKELKKKKRQTKKEFREQFDKEKRKILRQQNPHDTFHKVSYVKIG